MTDGRQNGQSLMAAQMAKSFIHPPPPAPINKSTEMPSSYAVLVRCCSEIHYPAIELIVFCQIRSTCIHKQFATKRQHERRCLHPCRSRGRRMTVSGGLGSTLRTGRHCFVSEMVWHIYRELSLFTALHRRRIVVYAFVGRAVCLSLFLKIINIKVCLWHASSCTTFPLTRSL